MNFDCVVCYEQYNDSNRKPQVLIPCGHTICGECLGSITNCPKCRKNIERTVEKDETRTGILILNIRYTIYQWVSRGLFEKHKLIFLSMITFRLMNKKVIEVAYTP